MMLMKTKSNILYHLITVLTVVLFFLPQTIKAQQEIKVPMKSLKVQWEGLTEALDNIQIGDKWAQKGKGALSKALGFYLKAYQYNPNCPELNCKIGLCYLKTDPKVKALPYLQNAYDKNKEITLELPLYLAKALQYNFEFDKAAQIYDSFYRGLKDSKKEKYATDVYKLIDECKNGKELMAQPRRAVVKNVGPSINSEYADYNPVLTGNDSLMFFVSRRPNIKHKKVDKRNYYYKEDVYAAANIKGEWREAVYFDEVFYNTKHNDAVVWVSDDGNTRYLYDGYKRSGEIYVSSFKKGKWTSPKRLNTPFNSKYGETSISITADGKTCYFVSQNPKENFGGKDIYYSRLNRKGKWDTPKNIGATINTRFDEDYINISADGKVLYFSSKGHNTMGGYDIFRTDISSGTWSKPVNLGIPVNTPDDDLCYKPLPGEKKAYYSSYRSDGLGGFDIYQVIFLGAEKQLLMRSDAQPIAYFYKPISDIFARITGEMKIDTTFILKGLITDAAKNTPIVAKFNLIDTEKGQTIASTISDSTGAYQVRISQIKNYGVEINAKDYMLYLDVITIPATVSTKEILKNFKLNKIKAGAKMVLKNIYFETGKAKLTPESFPELDKVIAFLQENNDLKIEISGHTDNVGGAAYNIKLSGDRAKAVVDYMVSKGIPIEQMVSKGYGPNQPIAPNTTAKGKQMNRRVEFKILSTE
jgi:outer membrane protein OmpA-like peptidoglycan-associated protein/tetratricopeptide (TPR) repeat protein